MLETYTLTYLETPLSVDSRYRSSLNPSPLQETSRNSNGSIPEVTQALQERLSGAYEFFHLPKITTSRYHEPFDPPNGDNGNPQDEKMPTGPPVTPSLAPPFPAAPPSLLCIPKSFPLLLLEEREGEEEEEDYDSDAESFYEDEEDCEWEEEPSNPLLNFAATVTSDLQRYFTRNKDDEGYCNVFEDKFAMIKSGRESYYADLLKVAQFGEDDCKESKAKSMNKQVKSLTAVCPFPTTDAGMTKHTVTNSKGCVSFCSMPHSGLTISEAGLGPFQELFDHVLREPLIKDELQGHVPNQTSDFSVMMKMSSNSLSTRKLPHSFWDEPGTNTMRELSHSTTAAHTLDFSDLLAGWTT